MKKMMIRLTMMIAVAISCSTAAEAQFVVKVRPSHPVIHARPPAPSRAHIWISGEWVWGNGRYNYRDGYWDRPSNRRYRGWVEGHWKHTRRGWTWMPGHWRR
jgi:WXXGXW repeat (2 copies)